MSDNYTIIDGLSVQRTFQSDESSGVHTPRHRLGFGDIVLDAWGIQKTSLPHSLFHGLWTFDIPENMWFVYQNNVQVYGAARTNVISSEGAAKVFTSGAVTKAVLESRECPRYQPNRGHLPATALWCPNPNADGVREWGVLIDGNGIVFRLVGDGTSHVLYAALYCKGEATETVEIDTSAIAGFDVSKGNVYDYQYQWRGVGNYKLFINLQLVHTFANLGTLTRLSIKNPALPCYFMAENTGEDVEMHIGCCDITSENGNDDREQPQVVAASKDAATGAVTNQPVVSIYNPLLIGSNANTRTVVLDSISVNSSLKGSFTVWVTRDLSHITGGTFAAVAGSGSLVEVNTAATAITAGPRAIAVIQVEAGVRSVERFTDNPRIRFTLVRGDYLIVTRTVANNGTSDIVIRWGEEI